jgi:hypothetical protein
MTLIADITWTITPLLGNQEFASDIYDELKINYPNLPANNHWSYIHPLLNNFYKEALVFIAVARSNDKLFIAIPLVLSKQERFGYRWIEFGLPFHKHMNLISIPDIPANEIFNIFLKLEKTIYIMAFKWHRLAIRNILLDSEIRPNIVNNNQIIEFSDDSSWFDTNINNGLESVISKKILKNLTRLQKKILIIDDECKLQEVSTKDDLNVALLSFRSIEESSWKGNKGVAINSSNKLISFYSEIITNFSAMNQAKIFHYASKDTIYASALGFHLGDTLYIHKISFDKNFMEVSPGSLLIFEIIKKSLLNDEIKKVSLVTYPDWARRWHPKYAPTINFISYSNTFTGQVLKHVITNWRKIKPRLKNIFSFLIEKKY